MALSQRSRSILGGLLGGTVLGFLVVLLPALQRNDDRGLLMAVVVGAVAGAVIALGALILRRL